MSVIMLLRIKGDPQKLEQWAAGNKETMRSIAERGKEHGIIAHRFYGSDSGEILVADEWPDEASFQRFFESTRSDIEPMLHQAASGEPEVTFWRKLETHDDVGWA